MLQCLEGGRNRKILVVDDEPDVSATFKKTLEGAGFDVDAFNDPVDAVEHFKAGVYDLVLLDIKMPHMSGFDLYRKLIGMDGRIKVCFITAFEIYFNEFRTLFPTLDVKCFLRKPISGKDLVEQVTAQLDPTIPDKCNSC